MIREHFISGRHKSLSHNTTNNNISIQSSLLSELSIKKSRIWHKKIFRTRHNTVIKHSGKTTKTKKNSHN
jgi:hypothetical protein